MPKAELYKISVADGKVMLRIPEQLVGAETADMDDIQAELHMMDVDYVPEELFDITIAQAVSLISWQIQRPQILLCRLSSAMISQKPTWILFRPKK